MSSSYSMPFSLKTALSVLLAALTVAGGQSPARAYTDPVTPRIAYTSYTASAGWEIWTIRPDGTDPRRMTTTAGHPSAAAYSPDGSSIAYQVGASMSAKPEHIWLVAVKGGKATRVTPSGWGEASQVEWLPDGSGMVFRGSRVALGASTYDRELFVVRRTRSGWAAPEQLTDTPGWPDQPTVARDGKVVAFSYFAVADKTAVSDDVRIYTMTMPPPGQVVRLENAHQVMSDEWTSSRSPSFSPDGTQLAFYQCTAEGGVHTVNVGGTDTKPEPQQLTAGRSSPCLVSWGSVAPHTNSIAYDVNGRYPEPWGSAIHRVDIGTREVTRVTPGEYGSHPSW